MKRLVTRRSTRGQSLVEFALVLPIFFLMLFGLIDMGRYVYLNSTLSQAAREAARVGSVEASWIGNTTDTSCNQPGGPVCPANVSSLRADMLAGGNRMMQPFAGLTNANFFTSCDASTAPAPVTTQTCATTAPSSLVSVRVQATFQPITPVISQLVGSITTSGSATMVIN